MNAVRRLEILARCLLTVGALLPYWPLLSFDTLYRPDDTFTSDLWNGELPTRKLIGDLLAHGELPTWTSKQCSGLPLIPSPDPLGIGLFAILPVAAALDTLVLILILVAAHGAYSLSRRVGADRVGAVLAGLTFSASGYMVGQLRHLGIIGTVAWLPLGLLMLDRGLCAKPPAPSDAAPEPMSRRAVWLVGFGFLYGEQVLAGFPQSAYICAICYAVFALFRVLGADHADGTSLASRFVPLSGALLMVCLGAAMGAAVLLPTMELGAVSDRAQGVSYAWASSGAYWPPNFLGFLFPYLLGDISDDTYRGPSIFWEDYGYVGLATFLLSMYAGVAERKRGITRLLLGITVVAYLLVLGPATPVFRVAFEYVPGFKLFRAPTRFLVVVDLGLCVLAALGLTRLRARLSQKLAGGDGRIPGWVALAICIGTSLDLLTNQPRQNPMVSASVWLEPPRTVKLLRALPEDPSSLRVLSPFRLSLHTLTFKFARGWSDLRPYFFLRDIIEPNSNLYWDIATADCYVGIAPKWHVAVFGSHTSRSRVIERTLRADFSAQTMEAGAAYPKLLAAYGVSHVITPLATPLLEPSLSLPQAPEVPAIYVYPVVGARRARVVPNAVRVKDDEQAVRTLLDARFDPTRVVLLAGAPASVEAPGERATDPGARAVIERDAGDELVVRAQAPKGGFLLLADTFYPGWRAEVNGRQTPIYRANISVRAVPLRAGENRVVFRYQAAAHRRGWMVSALAMLMLAFLLVLASVARLRQRAMPSSARAASRRHP